MFLMKNNFYFNLNKLYKKKNLTISKKEFLFKIIKNFYLLKKNYKNINLYSPQNYIQMYFKNFYFLNLITNLKTDKWFIYKLIN